MVGELSRAATQVAKQATKPGRVFAPKARSPARRWTHYVSMCSAPLTLPPGRSAGRCADALALGSRALIGGQHGPRGSR